MTTYRADFPQPEIVVTSLPKSADDLLLIGQRLKVGVAADQRDETAALVRRLAARHPDDPLAMLHLGHAELHFGDADVGESVLIRLLESEPENVEALQLLATRFITLASEKPEDADSLMRRAKGYLARAYAVAPTEYYTLQLLSRTRDGAADYPTENDLVTLYNALTHAPQLPSIRIAYASALMRAEEFSEASILLEPLANAAHGGGSVQAARLLLERARAGQRPLTEAELESVADSAEDSSDDQPAEPGSGSGAAEPDRSASGTTPPE